MGIAPVVARGNAIFLMVGIKKIPNNGKKSQLVGIPGGVMGKNLVG